MTRFCSLRYLITYYPAFNNLCLKGSKVKLGHPLFLAEAMHRMTRLNIAASNYLANNNPPQSCSWGIFHSEGLVYMGELFWIHSLYEPSYSRISHSFSGLNRYDHRNRTLSLKKEDGWKELFNNNDSTLNSCFALM